MDDGVVYIQGRWGIQHSPKPLRICTLFITNWHFSHPATMAHAKKQIKGCVVVGGVFAIFKQVVFF